MKLKAARRQAWTAQRSLVTVCGHTLYEPDLLPGSIVVDLGAHRGLFSLALATHYGCRCHAIEASPDLYSDVPTMDGVAKYHYAVCSANGTRSFNLANDPESSSIIDVVGSKPKETIDVPAIDLSTLVERHGIAGIDVLKIDIEGAEIEVLDAAPDRLLRTITQITVEFHEFNGLVRRADIERIRQRLDRLRFDCFRFPRRQYTDTLFLNRSRSRARMADRLWWRTLPYWRRLRRAVGEIHSCRER